MAIQRKDMTLIVTLNNVAFSTVAVKSIEKIVGNTIPNGRKQKQQHTRDPTDRIISPSFRDFKNV
tara:strand:+ start:290 stop:484 length:195 start_codon:yes stop_codon:yes gene_type:complete